MKLYGPYTRSSDGRKFVVEYDGPTKYYRTMLLSVYLLEQKLGRKLQGIETADHINEDKADDSIDNLQVLTLSENIRKSHPRGPRAEHGTITRAIKWGCNCEVCLETRKAWNTSKRLPNSPAHDGVLRHGTTRGYSYYGCRCEECKEAKRKSAKRYNDNHKGH